jgi:hypothetical protein
MYPQSRLISHWKINHVSYVYRDCMDIGRLLRRLISCICSPTHFHLRLTSYTRCLPVTYSWHQLHLLLCICLWTPFGASNTVGVAICCRICWSLSVIRYCHVTYCFTTCIKHPLRYCVLEVEGLLNLNCDWFNCCVCRPPCLLLWHFLHPFFLC